jgi:hypothetical protein
LVDDTHYYFQAVANETQPKYSTREVHADLDLVFLTIIDQDNGMEDSEKNWKDNIKGVYRIPLEFVGKINIYIDFFEETVQAGPWKYSEVSCRPAGLEKIDMVHQKCIPCDFHCETCTETTGTCGSLASLQRYTDYYASWPNSKDFTEGVGDPAFIIGDEDNPPELQCAEDYISSNHIQP